MKLCNGLGEMLIFQILSPPDLDMSVMIGWGPEPHTSLSAVVYLHPSLISQINALIYSWYLVFQ